MSNDSSILQTGVSLDVDARRRRKIRAQAWSLIARLFNTQGLQFSTSKQLHFDFASHSLGLHLFFVKATSKQLLNRTFHYDLRKHFFSARILNICNSLPNSVDELITDKCITPNIRRCGSIVAKN